MIRRVCALLVRELSAFYYSPVAYVVLFFFLILNGLAFWFSIAPLSHGPSEFTVVQIFFNKLSFWIAYLLVFPLITMRLFSEEFKICTIETFMTAPAHHLVGLGTKLLAA